MIYFIIGGINRLAMQKLIGTRLRSCSLSDDNVLGDITTRLGVWTPITAETFGEFAITFA